MKAYLAEFIGTFALIFIGVGAIANMGGSGDLLGIALAHGLTIACLVSATAAISGGHLNPAVTLGVLVGGKIDVKDAAFYVVAQCLGGIVAGFLLISLLPGGAEAVANGTPNLGATTSVAQGIVIEAVLTFFLVFVVYGTAVDGRAPKVGGLFIGLTVALDILFGGPLTGAAMNPARTLGSGLPSGMMANHVVYWIGPLLGGAIAGAVYGRFLIVRAEPGAH